MRAIPAALVLLVAAANAWAQLPAGAEFRANTYTTGQQVQTQPAVDAEGRFIITWDAGSGGAGPGAYVQRYGADGLPIGSEFRGSAGGPVDRTRAAFGKGG